MLHVQGEAIAYNLREMFGLRVPVISVVIGEGGSGGALAIGCANKNLIMENSVYYVASPEACAAILWKSRSASNQVRLAGSNGNGSCCCQCTDDSAHNKQRSAASAQPHPVICMQLRSRCLGQRAAHCGI